MSCPRCYEEFSEGTATCPHDGTDLILAVPDPLIGTTFAQRYEILQVIGRGGMSTVYKAQQKYIQSFVAIKILHSRTGADAAAIERFKTEAKAASTIRHINIVQVLDFGIEPQPFLIMEFLEGQSLEEYLEKHGSMEMTRAMNIFIQATDGLAHAHAKGIIHRDLKPGNLFLVKEEGLNDIVKIVDFGIAKVLPRDGMVAQNLTQPGEVFGSPLYMSPEQCQGQPLDARSDIYSLGCVIYETLTGMPPLMGSNSFETMNMHVHEQPLPLRGIAPDKTIPELIDATVLKAIRKEPEKRQQSMLELRKDLIENSKKSRLYVTEEEDREEEGYTPEQFTGDTGQYDAVPDVKAADQVAENSSKEMQQLVLDAVSLTKKQDQANKRLRTLMLVVLGAFAAFVGLAGFEWMKPGPPSDPASIWERRLYLNKMSEAETALNAGKYDESAAAYQAAADMAAKYGDGNDKKVRALMGWLNAMLKEGSPAAAINGVKEQVLSASLKHMEYMCDHGPKDFAEIVDMDAGVLKTLEPEKMDTATAGTYAKEMVDNARKSIQDKSYVKAISWLNEALAMEEQAHCNAGVAACASQLDASGQDKAHAAQIHSLVEKAQQAEKQDGKD